MNRTEKAAVVERLSETFSTQPNIVLGSFRGLTVNQATELRSRVRKAGGRIEVIKNRLAKRAAAGTPAEGLIEHFAGPCTVATHADDPVALAKSLFEFAKENPQLQLTAAVVDAKELVDAKGVKQLAALPGLPELRAQLLALLQTPATSFVRLLGTPGTQLARVLDARREREEQG